MDGHFSYLLIFFPYILLYTILCTPRLLLRLFFTLSHHLSLWILNCIPSLFISPSLLYFLSLIKMRKGFLSCYRDRIQFTYLFFWKLQCLKAFCLALPSEFATLFYPGLDYFGHKKSKSGHLLSSLFLPSSNVILHLSLFQLTFYVKGHSAPDFSNFIPTALPWPLLSPFVLRE